MVVYRAAAYHAPLWVEPNVTEGRFHRTWQVRIKHGDAAGWHGLANFPFLVHITSISGH